MESTITVTESSQELNMPEENQQDAETVSKTLHAVESWVDRLGGLQAVGRTTDELQELTRSLATEIDRLKDLRVKLQRPVRTRRSESRRSESRPRTEGSWASEATPGATWCTSELKLVSGESIPSQRTVEIHHPAIYVPLSQAGRDDEIKHHVEAPEELPAGRHELPEFIVMKSMRLLTYIEDEIHDGPPNAFNWISYSGSNVHFTIQRPFKMLAFFNNDIRNHLVKLEERRRSIKSMLTEDDYDDDWRLNPPPDGVYKPIQTVPQLTGLIKDFRALIKFMDHYIEPAISRKPTENVYFSDLWYTFAPGSLIYLKDPKVPQKIWRVVQRAQFKYSNENTEKGSNGPIPRKYRKLNPKLFLECYYLDFNGDNYIPISKEIFLENFDGLKPVTSLPAYPIQAAAADRDIDLEAMVNRGREFIECTRPSHRDYTGRNQLQTPAGDDMIESDVILPENVSRYSESIDSEVMVDIERALQAVPTWTPKRSIVSTLGSEVTDEDFGIDTDRDYMWDRQNTDRLMFTAAKKWTRWDRDNPPTEREDLLLLPGRIFAFVFRTRKWACLTLENGPGGDERLRRRQPRPEPWDGLELPDGHKNIVKSLIESRMDGSTSRRLHFDLVRAKGKGVIILLHGVPGVGKTSTAECAAEANNRPLLPITCGDLGTSPKDVESKLQEAFELAQLWNCVLLLDEADVFLAQRSEHDIQRNALVSVFLRVLEYYEGILFLTSNRVGVFDEAFKSRIHMALYYPPLEWKYTKRIWETHLTKLTNSGRVSLDHKDLVDYAETFFEEQKRHGSNIGPVWNGRQIRNAFQSAVALAGYKQEGHDKIVLTRDHFEKVSKVSNQFNHYLWSIQCKTDSDKAAIWGIRYDQWVKPGMTSNAIGSVPPLMPTNNSMPMDGGGPMSFGLNAAVAGPSYQQQQMTPQMQGFPQPQQQSGLMGVQNAFQGTHQQGQAQFGQQTGFIQPQQQQQQQQFGQQPQQLYSYQAPNQQPQPPLQPDQFQQAHAQQ